MGTRTRQALKHLKAARPSPFECRHPSSLSLLAIRWLSLHRRRRAKSFLARSAIGAPVGVGQAHSARRVKICARKLARR